MRLPVFVGLIAVAICWHSFIRFCCSNHGGVLPVSCGWKSLCIRCFLLIRSQKHSIFQNFLLYQLSMLALALMKTLSTACRLPRTMPLETHIFKTSLNKFKKTSSPYKPRVLANGTVPRKLLMYIITQNNRIDKLSLQKAINCLSELILFKYQQYLKENYRDLYSPDLHLP